MPTTSVTTSEYTGTDGTEQQQYRTTIPKSLAEAFEIDEDTKLEWTVGSSSRLEVIINNE